MKYSLDPESTRLTFSVRHMMVATVRGTFSDVSAEIDLDPSSLEDARATAKIGTASVQTKDRLRDNYLKSKDFFDPATFPHMEYRTTSVRPQGKKVLVSGMLKIRDQERQLILNGIWKDLPASGKTRLRFELEVEIDREAYGLVFNGAVETVSVVVGKKVSLKLEIEVEAASN
jgi:polyisoprenoid-binding protein YceI